MSTSLSFSVGVDAATRSRGGGVPPAGFVWLSDFEGNPVYDAEGVRLYGAI